MHDRVLAVAETQQRPQRVEHKLRHAGDVKNDRVHHGVDRELDYHLAAMVVPRWRDAHESVYGYEPVGVHRAYVVQHVRVRDRRTDHQHQEIQPEQHLRRSPERVILLDPEERKVTCNRDKCGYV